MPLPPPPAPPKSNSKKNSDAFAQWVRAHPAIRRWASDIRWTARLYGLDPIYIGAVMMLESRGNPNARSSAGAIGLMQVMPRGKGYSRIGQPVPWDPSRKITEADLRNPEFNIRFGTMLLSQAVSKYGYAQAYSHAGGYNPGYRGPGPRQFVGKDYIFGSGGAAGSGPASSPEGSAQRSVETGAAKAQLLRGQAFLQEKLRIDTIYEAYTGKRATNGQARVAIQNGWSDYHLEVLLSQGPKFVGSPVWKTHAPDYIEAYRAMHGENAKPPTKLIAYAIIHNVDGAGFQGILRQRKDYVKSNEFKTNVSSLENIYRKIYGAPDQTGIVTIQRAVLNGWSPDQFAKFLRSQPEYGQSQEFGSGVMGLLQTIGGVTGQGVVLTPGQAAPYAAPGGAAKGPKTDKRVKGKPGVGVGGPSYTPGLSSG